MVDNHGTAYILCMIFENFVEGLNYAAGATN